jgi:uncharacterized protein (DUF697 family)
METATKTKDNESGHHTAKNATEKHSGEKVIVERHVTGRLLVGEEIVKKASYWAAGCGVVPVPLFDLAAVTAVQLAMLAKLCTLYEIPFAKDLGKNLIGSLTGGLAASTLSPVVGSMLKFIPVVGYAAAVATMPALSGAATWAVGRVFLMHFESDGTLLDFDPASYRKHLDDMIKEGKKTVS